MERKALTKKMIVLGVDGFEPSLAKKFMQMGKMPNLKKFVEAGSAREDLVLMGSVPTVTPPMWTTLATGAHASTHGITAFFNQHPEKLDTAVYALDSRLCQAEPLWNVFAENGLKTLVWHWPGSSWPPTSDSENLHVVDGTQPTAINMGTAICDWEKLGMAAESVSELRFSAHDAPSSGVNGCVITDLGDDIADENAGKGAESLKSILGGGREFTSLVMSEAENEIATLGNITVDVCNSPIKAAINWNDAPVGAKEFTMLTSGGYTRRPCLILPNENGIYDRIAIYKSKKDTEPIVTMKANEFTSNVVDEIIDKGVIKNANRNMEILEIAADGSYLRYWMSSAYDITSDAVWHPKSLYRDIVQNVGIVPPVSTLSGSNPEHVEKILLKSLDNYCQWQADCLTYLINEQRYDMIFSHLHNVDNVGHLFWHYAKHFEEWNNDEKFYQEMIGYIYEQTDRYLGRFLPYLEQEWTVIITSDHGLICEDNHPPVLTEGCVSIPVMQELGYTVLKKDENGNDLREIDWSKTRAIAIRGGNIYINLKGRNATGIVEEKDKYDLEAQIISDLYNYRDPHTHKRVVAMALRNRDAVFIGLGGEGCGDISFFMEEGYNLIHMDSLPTQRGYFDTSVSPIFVAAGAGVKKGLMLERVIRQVDVAPTMAVLAGVRMPAQNEGSVLHQILTESF